MRVFTCIHSSWWLLQCPLSSFHEQLDPMFPHHLALKRVEELQIGRKLHQLSRSIVSNLPVVTGFLGYLLNLACALLSFPTASRVWQAGATNRVWSTWMPWWLCLHPGSMTFRESCSPANHMCWRTHHVWVSFKCPQKLLKKLPVSH